MNLTDFPFLNFNFIPKAKKRNNLEMDQDKEKQLKSYMDRLPPPTKAELEALASYSSKYYGSHNFPKRVTFEIISFDREKCYKAL